VSAVPIRLGVLGCAGIAWRKMLPALAHEPGVVLTAVASRQADRAARFAERFGGEPVVGYEALLERSDVDAVYVPLPAVLHAPWIRRTLAAGKHVLAEKPMATAYADAAELVGLAERAGLVLVENFMFTRHEQHTHVRKLVADGVLGELRGLSAAFTIPPLPDDDIRYSPSTGGGALVDVGGYPVRTASMFLGADATLVGATLRMDGRRGVDVGGAALLTNPDGVVAHLTFGMEHAYRCEYELWGSAGRLRLTRAYTPPADHEPVLTIERADGVEELRLPPDDQFANVLHAFVGEVRCGVPSGLSGPAILAQAALVQRIRDAALRIPVAGNALRLPVPVVAGG